MQQTPKKRRRYAFPFLFLGLLIALILVGLASVLYLIYMKQAVTLANILELHTTLLFIYIDIIAIYSALVFSFVGYQKDRAEDARLYSAWLEQNQKREIAHVQDGQVEMDKKHQDEVARLNEQLTKQGTTFQDVESIIRHGKQQWQATFDAVNDLIVLADENGSIIRCNRATAEVFKLGFTQIIGQKIDDLFSTGAGTLQGMIPGEKKDLKLHNQDIYYEISKNHLLVDGRQEGWVYIFRNVTLQKQAFRDQQRLTQYYELLVNNSPVAVVTLNLEDKIIDCNPAFESMFQYDKKEVTGQKVDELISPPDLLLETRMMTQTVRSGGKVQSVTQRKRKDGSLLDVEVYGIPVVLSGKQIGTLGLYHDVSDLVRYRTAAMAEVAQAITEAAEPAAEEPLPVEEPPAPESETVMQEELAPETVLEEAHAPMEEPAMESEPLTSTRPPKRLVPIEDIEGIGPVYAEKLLSVGIKTTSDLLDQGKDRKGRELLVQKTGISHVLVLKWVNMADLMRIKGIGEEYSELLEKAGVDTVRELRNRVPENLHAAMLKANETHKLVRRPPHLSEVADWIKEAQESEPIMTY